MHAKLLQKLVRIGEDVHQMGNGRALIPADIRDPRLQKRLGDSQNAFSAKFCARADA
ncbi:MAG TPA: hypothetical protein VG843_13440 [Rhizomicrobium sp.]|nr:hypothetical protein [Rhizomicrobium sp.]